MESQKSLNIAKVNLRKKRKAGGRTTRFQDILPSCANQNSVVVAHTQTHRSWNQVESL